MHLALQRANESSKVRSSLFFGLADLIGVKEQIEVGQGQGITALGLADRADEAVGVGEAGGVDTQGAERGEGASGIRVGLRIE